MSAWLSGLRLSQYEGTMVEAGYDDLDFICDIALDDLHDIGITKRGGSPLHTLISDIINIIRSCEAVTSRCWGVDRVSEKCA